MAETMKAVVIHEAGGPEVLKVERRPLPTPEPGWVLLQVKAFGLNRSEMFTRQVLDFCLLYMPAAPAVDAVRYVGLRIPWPEQPGPRAASRCRARQVTLPWHPWHAPTAEVPPLPRLVTSGTCATARCPSITPSLTARPPWPALNPVQAPMRCSLQGHSPSVKFPRILGIEACGIVVEAPGGEFKKGAVVATAMGGMGRQFEGGYAEYTCVPVGQVQVCP